MYVVAICRCKKSTVLALEDRVVVEPAVSLECSCFLGLHAKLTAATKGTQK